VVCTDVDRVCEQDLARAAAVVDHRPGAVTFRPTDGARLPFEDGELDAMYCVSVLEHVPDFESLIEETARVLKPGGLFLLTVDIDLRGDMELGVAPHRKLVAALGRAFAYGWPETTIHPADLLDSSSGPYGVQAPAGWRRRRFLFRQRVKALLGRKPHPLLPYRLAVQAFALVRK
jgi:SAM-dependent methyltransferase